MLVPTPKLALDPSASSGDVVAPLQEGMPPTQELLTGMICPRDTEIQTSGGPLPKWTLDYVEEKICKGEAANITPVVLLVHDGKLYTYDGNTRLTKSYELGVAIPYVALRPGDKFTMDYSFYTEPGGTLTVEYDKVIESILAKHEYARSTGLSTFAQQLERAYNKHSKTPSI